MRIEHRLIVGLLLLSLPACVTLPRRNTSPVVAGSPASFIRLATEAQTSRVIMLRQGIGPAVAWRTLNDYLAGRYTVAVRDQTAGFVMTAWEATLAREGVPDLRYRTRLTIGFVGEEWQQLHIRADANWKEGEEWQVGYDRELLERVTRELRILLGPTDAARQ